MRVRHLAEMSNEELLNRLARIEERFPARKADVRFLTNTARVLLAELNEKNDALKKWADTLAFNLDWAGSVLTLHQDDENAKTIDLVLESWKRFKEESG